MTVFSSGPPRQRLVDITPHLHVHQHIPQSRHGLSIHQALASKAAPWPAASLSSLPQSVSHSPAPLGFVESSRPRPPAATRGRRDQPREQSNFCHTPTQSAGRVLGGCWDTPPAAACSAPPATVLPPGPCLCLAEMKDAQNTQKDLACWFSAGMSCTE